MVEKNDVFNKVNIRHFALLRYLLENMDDDHITCKISCILRSDRIDTPHYMDVKIKLTHCTGLYEKGIYHAMDILSHQRMYNLTQDRYEILEKTFKDNFREDEMITLRIEDKLNQLTVLTRTSDELMNVLDKYNEFFAMVDDLA